MVLDTFSSLPPFLAFCSVGHCADSYTHTTIFNY